MTALRWTQAHYSLRLRKNDRLTTNASVLDGTMRTIVAINVCEQVFFAAHSRGL